MPRPRPPFCAAASVAAAAAAVVAAISASEMRPTRGAALMSTTKGNGVDGGSNAHGSTGRRVASAKRTRWLKKAVTIVSSTTSLSVKWARTWANCSSVTPWMSRVSDSA